MLINKYQGSTWLSRKQFITSSQGYPTTMEMVVGDHICLTRHSLPSHWNDNIEFSLLEAEAVSVEVLTTFSSRRMICVRVQAYTQIVCERQRAQIVMYYVQMATTTFTKGYKVTLYNDWLRTTALYTIYRSSLNLDCSRESVNTVIIHSYSTLPRNGCMQGLNRNYRYIQGCRTSWFCWSRQSPRIEG